MFYDKMSSEQNNLGQLNDALRSSRKVLEIREQIVRDHPNIPEYKADLSFGYSRLALRYADDPTQVERLNRRAITILQEANFPPYRWDLARLHGLFAKSIQQRNPDEAIAELRKALAIRDQLAGEYPHMKDFQRRKQGTRNSLARYLVKAGREAEVEQLIREMSPHTGSDFEMRGDYYRLLGQDEKAKTDYAKALKLGLERGAKNREKDIGDYLVGHKEYQLAVGYYSEILAVNPQNHIFKRRGAAYMHLKQYDKALSDISRAIETDPLDSDYYMWNLSRFLQEAPAEFHMKCIALADRAIELTEGLPGGYSTRGFLYASLHRWDEALEDYTKAIELDPDLTNLTTYEYYRKALILLHLGDEKGYRHICATMVEKEFPKWTSWTCALAPASGKDYTTKDYTTPIALAQQASSGDLQNSMLVQYLGAILFRAGRIDEAIGHLTRAEQMLKASASGVTSPAYTWFLLSMAHHQDGHDAKAQTYLNKAIDRAETELDDETHPPLWNRRLTLQLFRKEAENLISIPVKAPKPKLSQNEK